MPGTKRISIANELDEIADALAAARLIADDLRNEQLGTDADAIQAPRMIAAVVGLSVTRMNLVVLVLRGSIDPRLLWTAFNDTEGLDPDSQEVVVAEWDARQRITYAENELRRMKRRRSRHTTESES